MTTHDFSDIRGLDTLVRAVAEAAIRGQSMMLVGPPGVGRTMLARRIPGVLPDLSDHERRWIAAEHSAHHDVTIGESAVERPFRAPHYTVSQRGLVGGTVTVTRLAGTYRATSPGEVGLARFGVLFLDELHEFSRGTLGALVDRLRRMPTGRPLLVATTMECPCGWHGSAVRTCVCTADAVRHFQARVAGFGDLLAFDRMFRLRSLSADELRNAPPGPSTAELRAEFLRNH